MISSVLPQRGNKSALVSVANNIARKIAQERELSFLAIDLPSVDNTWFDDVHLSDWGLCCFMESLEIQAGKIMQSAFNFDLAAFPPLPNHGLFSFICLLKQIGFIF